MAPPFRAECVCLVLSHTLSCISLPIRGRVLHLQVAKLVSIEETKTLKIAVENNNNVRKVGIEWMYPPLPFNPTRVMQDVFLNDRRRYTRFRTYDSRRNTLAPRATPPGPSTVIASVSDASSPTPEAGTHFLLYGENVPKYYEINRLHVRK